MTIKERLENNEKLILSQYATLSSATKGRKKEDDVCEMRTEFQRDRDRIIHCNSFRRLKHKTQVFLAPEGDHYRTRLTHTLEVAQIARTIARALGLNEDLTEAISLGHDLGHTPFGHAGERALDEVCGFSFRHYEQSVRVCEVLERDGAGLNLTAEVLDGIMCHTRGAEAFTPEGRIVRIADKIAYISHDIDDSIRAGIITNSDIPREINEYVGEKHSQRINTFVSGVILNSDKGVIKMDDKTFEIFNKLHEFMFESVYTNPVAKGEESKAEELVKRLFSYYCSNRDKLPGEYRFAVEQDGVERAAADYISGMSDRYAAAVYKQLFIPRSWGSGFN